MINSKSVTRWRTYRRSIEPLHTSVHPSAFKIRRFGSFILFTFRSSDHWVNCRFLIIRPRRPRLCLCRRHAAEIAAGLNHQPRLCRQSERGRERARARKEESKRRTGGWSSYCRRSEDVKLSLSKPVDKFPHLTEKVFKGSCRWSVVHRAVVSAVH